MPSYPFNVADGLCAGAAQAAALCTLVIRGAQRGLTKTVSHTTAAELALSTCIKCSGCASLPAEGLRSSPCLRATWHPRTPMREKGGSGRAQEVPDPYGGPRSRPSARIFPCLEARGVSGPIPRRGNGFGAVGLVREEPGPWGLATLSFPRSYG